MIQISCEYTSSGWLVSWRVDLPPDGSLAFLTGAAADDLEEQFTSADAVGTETVDTEGQGMMPGAVCRMDLMDASGTITESSAVLPLIPGLSADDCLELDTLRRNFEYEAIVYGDEGELFRKRTTGTPCPDCTDPLTGLCVNSSCSSCGGSGYVQGWIGPFAVSVILSPTPAEASVKSGSGMDQEVYETICRLSAFPRPRADDILSIPERGKVYIVGHPQKTVVGVRGHPAVVSCPLRIPASGNPDATFPVDTT